AVLLPVGGPVLVHGLGHALGRLDDLAGLDERLQQTRLRDDRDVGRVPAGDLGDDVALEALVAGVLHLDAGVLLERLEGLVEVIGLDAGDAAGDADGRLAIAVPVAAAGRGFRASGQGARRRADHGEGSEKAVPL